jgi:hypothetical protein
MKECQTDVQKWAYWSRESSQIYAWNALVVCCRFLSVDMQHMYMVLVTTREHDCSGPFDGRNGHPCNNTD